MSLHVNELESEIWRLKLLLESNEQAIEKQKLDNKNLRLKCSHFQEKNVSLSAENKSLRQELSDLTANLKTFQERASRSEVDRSFASASLKNSQAEVKSLKKTIEVLNGELAELRKYS